MKARKILALSIAIATAATVSTAAFAGQITETNNSGETTVTASIVNAPGEVSYSITIPNTLGFDELTQPDTYTDSFKDVIFEVAASKIENLPAEKRVLVRILDKNTSDADDNQFFITQTTSPNTKLTYDIFDHTQINPEDNPVNRGELKEGGYLIAAFSGQGDKTTGTLRLNQKQLYGKDISEIAGDYTGGIVFTSSIA